MAPSLPGYNSAITRLLLLALAISLVACHATTRPAHPASPALDRLKSDIDAILGDPVLAHGYWGVVVKSLKNDDTIYALNARRLMMQASNMKIVTLAAAAERLGWDFTYKTTIAMPSVANGLIDGDVRVIGSGDPSIGAADGVADRVFSGFAEQLKSAGVRGIAGGIVGDGGQFAGEDLGFGWSWDDLQDDYAAGVRALQFNENMVQVTVGPGPAPGDYAAISVSPLHSGIAVRSAVTTTTDANAAVRVRRLPGTSILELSGSIAARSAPRVLSVSVDNPTLFFVESMRAALIANGIDVRGPAVDMRDAWPQPPPLAGPVVTLRTSAPLSTLAIRLMKVSQNQYAETLLRTMGAHSGEVSDAESGRRAVLQTLESWGVPSASIVQRDGSGLSRYDYVTPEALVAILSHVDRDPKLKGPFEAALPIAGRDGTLRNRMKDTSAEGNARAKTGSMANVRGLSGYVTAADGERLVFSILANNFETPADTITKTADAIVVRLAQFRR